MRPLPIDDHLSAIVRAIRERRGAVIVAEPGAGKTTRVPRALLDAGLADAGVILVVEPRRLAASMAAARVAEELGEPLGGRIGYRVRFESAVSRDTRVLFVTEGILARRLAEDPGLDGVAAVIFDEIHERSLEMDLGLARVRLLRERAREIALVAMSATLESEPLARFLDAPTFDVPGRAFDVEVRYDDKPDDRPLERRVRAALVRLFEGGLEGDVLVFLPGAAEIRRALSECAGPVAAKGALLLPLHGDLPKDEQARAIRPNDRRKVILSTNVAETSLTIDGVTAVIDSGLARVAKHDPWSGIASLVVQSISRASATQRSGRAGRTRPGVAVRLYTRADHDARPERDAPEIARGDLSQAVLALRAAGHDPFAFPYFEAPPRASLEHAEGLLARLGAIEGGGLSELGRAMMALPAHPRVARVALEAHRLGHSDTGAALAALIAERDVRRASRTRFGGSAAASDEVASSDLLVRLDALERVGDPPNRSALAAEELDPIATRQVLRAKQQLARALRGVSLDVEPMYDEEAALLQATFAGFPDRVARRKAPRSSELIVAGGTRATLAETSAVKESDLMVLVDVVEARGTPYVHRASAIDIDTLMRVDLERIEDRVVERFDAERERVVADAELRYDGVLLERTPRAPDPERAAAVLAAAAKQVGAHRFVDPPDALDALERRLRFAQRFAPDLPSLDEARIDRVLLLLSAGRASFAELRDASLYDALRADLGGSALARLDRIAPTHVSIPGRARVEVRYEHDRPPWIESRLQDFFGAAEGPRIAEGREPLLLHLLAPNRRAVQITTDLAGFWDRHYEGIKKELKRRYPRHAWPDDPRVATPRGPTPRR
ncbi:MAG: ATP-dependent helicase HrpB [Sandaracinaceae bacterium]